MTKDDIEKLVIAIIAEILNVDPKKVEHRTRLIDDLGADSLDTVEITMRVEDEFGITIPDKEASKIVTISDIIAYIEKEKA